MKMLLGLFWLSLIFGPNQVWALSCKDANRFYMTKYKEEFNMDLGDEIDCIVPDIGYHAIVAINDLHQLTFKQRQNNINYYEFLKENSRSIGRDRDHKAVAYNSQWGDIFLTKYFVSSGGMNRGQRARNLIHEARHSFKEDPRHVDCTQGSQKDKERACDETFQNSLSAGSGYNAGVYFLQDVIRNADYVSFQKKILKAGLKFRLANRFNTIPESNRKTFNELMNIKIIDNLYRWRHYQKLKSVKVKFDESEKWFLVTDLKVSVKDDRLVTLLKYRNQSQTLKNGFSHPVARFSKTIILKLSKGMSLTQAEQLAVLKKFIGTKSFGLTFKELKAND